MLEGQPQQIAPARLLVGDEDPSDPRGQGDCCANPSPAAVSSFVADPFLVLDNDLDDVSEVIRHNILTDESSGRSTPSLIARSNRSCSDNEAATGVCWAQTGGTSPNNDFEPSKEHQIGQIVSLLQEEETESLGQQQPQQLGVVPATQQFVADHPQYSGLGYSPAQIGAMLDNPQGVADPLIGGELMSPVQNQPGMVQQQEEFVLMEQLNQQQNNDYIYGMGAEFEQYTQQQQMVMLQQQQEQHHPNLALTIEEPVQYQQEQQHFGAQQQMMLDQAIPLDSPPPPPLAMDFPAHRHIKQEIIYGLPEPSAPFYQQTPASPRADQMEAAVAAKHELIRLLLEMSPEELERLRVQRVQQQQQRRQLYSQPHSEHLFVAPPPPLTQNISCQHQQLQQHYGAGGGEMVDCNSQAISFCPSSSSATSSALTSPNAYHASIGPSDYFGEEDSAMDEEMWAEEGEMAREQEGARAEEEEEEGKTQTQGQTQGGGGGGRRRGHKTERRTAHNLIEKKYRCSINDRINQLKEMLATEETTKLSKSATLRRAVDHIFALRSKNADLAGENARLRQTLEMAGLAPPQGAPRQAQITTVKQEIRGSRQEGMVLNGKTPRGRAASVRKSTASVVSGQNKDQSRVTLCVFMFLMLAFNPLASLFFDGTNGADEQFQQPNSGAVSEAIFGAHHRTLLGDDRFSAVFAGGAVPRPTQSLGSGDWWVSPFLRHSLIWLLNSLLVFIVLTRLLVYGEPVADRRSPRWGAFVVSRQRAEAAIASGNYKEAQRELGESLQILERPLPHAGSVDEWMSLTWQIIRHLLNGLWIGRWFARRRRPSVPRHSVCRSHAATALVYHQLHQLHLLDVDGIGFTSRGAFNLALLAANLAESAGPSAIAHSLRAEIYLCAAVRSRLCLPKCVRRVVAAYFFRRAKRHVRKSGAVEGAHLPSLRWMFHPLARRFLARPAFVGAILNQSGALCTPNWPFSASAQSAKPVEVLRDAFKMHLMGKLLRQLQSPEGTLRAADFVEQSQLLLDICERDNIGEGREEEAEEDAEKRKELQKGGREEAQNSEKAAGDDVLRPLLSEGDPLCAWWTHLVTGGLHWRHGDSTRAQKHYALVRKCPPGLAQNDLALALGLAFCTRKMCFEDRQKGKFAEMVVWHARRANAHLKRSAWTAMTAGGRDRASSIEGVVIEEGDRRRGEPIGETPLIQHHFRLLCCQWLLCSLLDVWSFCFAHCGLVAPLEIRRLYADVLGRMEREQDKDEEKLAMFRQLGKSLCGMRMEGPKGSLI